MIANARKKVLIVDDNEAVCAVLKKLLESENVEVQMLHHGHDARKYLRKASDLDLVLLDLFLPGLPGWELLDEIDDNPLISDVPVVLVSGAPISGTKKKELRKRVAVFLDKEVFDLDEFKSIASKLISERDGSRKEVPTHT